MNSDSQNTVGSLSQGCKPWGFWASLAWGFAAIAVWLGAQTAIGSILIERFDGAAGAADVGRLATHGPFVALVTIAAAAAPLVVIVLAVQSARCRPSEYLGLRPPAARYVVLGLVSLAIIMPLADLASSLAGYAVTPQFVLDLYRSARQGGGLVLLVIALAVAAPLVEEIVFRGFLLPGFAASPIGAPGAILLTAAAWALMHGQYQPFYLIQIVVLGILFGWLRLRSGSTVLTIMLHGLVNLAAIVQAAAILEWAA